MKIIEYFNPVSVALVYTLFPDVCGHPCDPHDQCAECRYKDKEDHATPKPTVRP